MPCYKGGSNQAMNLIWLVIPFGLQTVCISSNCCSCLIKYMSDMVRNSLEDHSRYSYRSYLETQLKQSVIMEINWMFKYYWFKKKEAERLFFWSNNKICNSFCLFFLETISRLIMKLIYSLTKQIILLFLSLLRHRNHNKITVSVVWGFIWAEWAE